MLVLPPVVPVSRGRRRAHAGSRLESRAVSRRAGEEAPPRSYTPGDPRCRIAWRRSAAIGTLVVEETAPTEPRV
ncbi:MAG: hypothetical protein R3B49_11645 [Phycisphaerales bacterium]